MEDESIISFHPDECCIIIQIIESVVVVIQYCLGSHSDKA